MRVLLVENNEDDVRVIEERLAHLTEPITLEYADRLSAALERLAHDDIDVVLLDLGLPDSRGFDTFDQLRARAPLVPIVVLTGSYADEALAVRALREGAQDYLLKDQADGRAVVHAMRYAIERKRMERTLRALNERLEQLALLDPLTGLLNRRGLQQVLSQETQRARREGTTLCALLLDLDDFKHINDLLGLTVGDQALVQVAQRLKASTRATDHLARIGGDEFLVLLSNTRPAEGRLIAEKLRRAIAGVSLPSPSPSSMTVTASFGLVPVAETTASIDELLAHTQSMLQRSKQAGKDQVSAGEEAVSAAQAAPSRHALLSILRRGDQFHAVSQPIFSLDEMKPVGYEFLSRLRSEGFEMPEDFFRISAQVDLLTLVDHHCLRACLAASATLPPHVRRHVNLFPSTILQLPVPQLLEELRGQGRAGATCIEVSEQQMLGEPASLAKALRAFQQAGVLIAMDHVGFGRSSLESLLLLQPQIVKIDQTCVRGIGRDEARTRSFRRLLQILEGVRADVVAGGIDAADDLEVVKGLGVKYGQGFLLGRPT